MTPITVDGAAIALRLLHLFITRREYVAMETLQLTDASHFVEQVTCFIHAMLADFSDVTMPSRRLAVTSLPFICALYNIADTIASYWT